MNVSLFRHAFFLILLSLVGALFIPMMVIPRLGLSAHTVGLLSGTLLIAIGAIWPYFHLSILQEALLKWSWLYAGYANWLGCLAGALLGAGQTTPVASAEVVGSDFAEGIVAVLLGSVAVVSFVAVGLALWALRPVTRP